MTYNMKTNYQKITKHIGYCLICCVAFLCTASQCSDDSDQGLEKTQLSLLNNSDEAIYVAYSNDTKILTPSVVFMRNGMSGVAEIAPGLRFYATVEYPASVPPKGYYQFIVFKKSTIKNHSLPDIMNDGIFDARYIYNLEEFKQMGNEIVFDGKEYIDGTK